MMQTTDIMHSINHLEKAADCLYEDYLNDNELTIFTQLDCEDFYAKVIGYEK